MSLSPAPQATAHACLRAALRADAASARARLGAGIAALILTLLLHLLARTEAAWDIIPEYDHDEELPPHALAMPTMGRAPHAAAFEAGLVPDWIFTSRNRGMRPAARPLRLHPRARPARAPPVPAPVPR
jgi:hypothetical protein